MILDTNAVSAMADGDSLIEPLLRRAEELALPVIVLGEYRYGIRKSRHRAEYEQWLEELMLSCRILDIDQETTEHYAALRVDLKQLGQPIPGNDMWIAALARQHKMPVISRDGHFDGVPQVKRAGW